MAVARLVGQLRIGDERTDETDQVGRTAGQQLLALLRGDESTHREDRNAPCYLPDLLGIVRVGRSREAHVGDHPVDRRIVRLADADEIDLGPIDEVFDDLGALGRRQPVGHELVGTQPDAHREVRTYLFSHCPYDRQRQPGPVLQRSSVLVGSLVREPAEELTQEIAMGEVDLQPVEFRPLRSPCGRPVATNQLGDVAMVHGVRNDATGGIGNG